MSPGRVLRTANGEVTTLTLSNPTKANAVSPEMVVQFRDHVRTLSSENAPVLLVTGEREKFCAGFDLTELLDDSADAELLLNGYGVPELCEELLAFPGCTIAAIGGDAFGVGVSLAACCDVRIAAEFARIGVPATQIGIPYSLRSANLLSELVGKTWSSYLLFTGRSANAQEMALMGFVTHVVARNEFASYVTKLADQIASAPPASIRYTKAIMRLLRESHRIRAKEEEEALRRDAIADPEARDRLLQTLIRHSKTKKTTANQEGSSS